MSLNLQMFRDALDSCPPPPGFPRLFHWLPGGGSLGITVPDNTCLSTSKTQTKSPSFLEDQKGQACSRVPPSDAFSQSGRPGLWEY